MAGARMGGQPVVGRDGNGRRAGTDGEGIVLAVSLRQGEAILRRRR